MYGVSTTSEGLQKFAASRLRQILHSLTKRSLLALIFGMVMTVAFQSSAATTVLVVEFVNVGLMNLAQALGIVLGSAVGTSLTIQLIAFQISTIALGIIFIGFILYILKQGRSKYLGQALIGFGIIFVGMDTMARASEPLKNIPQVYQFLAHLGSNPLLAIMVGLIFTALIQSTPAVFAVIMSLAGQHLLPIDAVILLVLGAHTGGTMTTLVSSFAAPKMDAKRTALANTGYKVVATCLVLPFLNEYAKVVQWTTTDLQRQVANAHLLFALLMVVIFAPFNAVIARWLVRVLPDKKGQRDFVSMQFIDESATEVPAVALKQVSKELVALGQMIRSKMLEQIAVVVTGTSEDAREAVLAAEKSVDWY
ncbi:MAG: Na/Pi symporter, partial [Peptococcaceae bacterium]|nr:Na/Pi symporter [Peptococcaceae bacterium]